MKTNLEKYKGYIVVQNDRAGFMAYPIGKPTSTIITASKKDFDKLLSKKVNK